MCWRGFRLRDEFGTQPVTPGERPPGRAEGPPEDKLRREGREPSKR
jgi:hypothetical protein